MSQEVVRSPGRASRRARAALIAGVAGILFYHREWLVLAKVFPFPETTFFEGFPSLYSAMPAIVFALGVVLRDHPFTVWAAFFLPSMAAHHAVMLVSSGMFPMWPAFLGAHLALILVMLALVLLGAWLARRYRIP